MSALSKKLRSTDDGGVMFWCPGCDSPHVVWVEKKGELPCWSWDGDVERPTFAPSLLVRYRYGHPPVTSKNFEEYKRNPWPQTTREAVCHSFIRGGRIEFLNDCTHALAGKTVEIPDFDSDDY